MSKNPFRPTFGISPLVWKGRDAVIAAFDNALKSGAGSPARALVIDGARGIGKTALTNELVRTSRTQGWIPLRTRSTSSIASTLRDSLIPEALRQLDSSDTQSKRSLDSISIAGIGGISTSKSAPTEPTPTLELRLRQLLDALKPHGTGVVITIDEVQDANPEDLSDIAGAYQMLIQDEYDIALIFTGLSEGIQRLLSLPGTTFMRRALRFTLGSLEANDTEAIFIETAKATGNPFDEDAAALAASTSQGYPYLIQLIGYLAWEQAETRNLNSVSTAQVRGIIDTAIATLGEQVHAPSLKSLPTRQREFLQAMAQAQETSATPIPIATVAEHMGKSVTSISDLRQRLIDKELIESNERGYVEFTLPYLGQHLKNMPARRRIS